LCSANCHAWRICGGKGRSTLPTSIMLSCWAEWEANLTIPHIWTHIAVNWNVQHDNELYCFGRKLLL
jgi:hypothetical protein